jgi:Pectate lyase superfamily protein/Right handed beta helix region
MLLAASGRGDAGDVINVKDQPFGAKGDGWSDDTAAIQRAIVAAAGRPILVPSGTYVITSSLTYRTSTTSDAPGLQLSGDGMLHTIFDNRVSGGPLLSIDGSVTPGTFQKGGWLRDFSIRTTTSPGLSHGLELRGGWYYTLERLRIARLTGDGIRLTSALGDPDAPAFVTIRQSEVRSNLGIGIHFNSSPGVVNTGGVEISGSQIVSNAGGGIKYVGIGGAIVNSSVAYNGGFGGLHIKYNGGGPAALTVRNVEFDANTGAHVRVDAGGPFNIETSQFQFQDIADGRGFQPTKGLVIGDGTANPLANVRVWGARVRSTPAAPRHAVTMYEIARNASDVTVLDTAWLAFGGKNATRFADEGTNTSIRDGGAWIFFAERHVLQSPVTSPYTPDLLSGSLHRLRVDKSPLAIRAPTGAADGRRIVFSIFNNTGGPLIVDFDPVYLQPTFVPPASGKRKTATFLYDRSSRGWILVGQWSSDF